MQTFSYKNLLIIIPFLIFYFSFFLPNAVADSPKTILVLPIDLNAESDLAYLKQGITDMIASRLSIEEKIFIIPKNRVEKAASGIRPPVTQLQAEKLGKELTADYVIFGSITLFGESISTDTRMIETQSGHTVVQFHRTGQSRSELIPHIDAFASRIKSEVFGLTPSPSAEKAEAPSENLHQHPDKLLQAVSPPLLKRMISRKYKMEIRGLATGDVTGDGKKEIVLIDHNNIFIYRPIKDGFQRIGEVKEKSFNNFLTVDVADINRNGRAEIFVVNLPHSGERMQSFVLENDGKTYRRIVERQPLFFRTMQKPDGSKILLGQEHESNINTFGNNQFFRGSVREMTWSDGEYVFGEAIILPRGGNILNFAKGDVVQSGTKNTVQYSSSNVLKIFDSEGKEDWVAEESFGSQATYMEFFSNKKEKELNRLYLPTRIFTTDVDQDGKPDILAVKNEESLSSFGRIKVFKNGRLVCLSWDGLNFKEIWQTETVHKFISDFDVADLTGQGAREVIYAVVAKEKGSWKDGQSYIVREPLPRNP